MPLAGSDRRGGWSENDLQMRGEVLLPAFINYLRRVARVARRGLQLDLRARGPLGLKAFGLNA